MILINLWFYLYMKNEPEFVATLMKDESETIVPLLSKMNQKL